MGLDISHDAWHGAYSAFTRWRNKVAEIGGYQIGQIDTEMKETPSFGYPTALLHWGAIRAENFYGEWDETPGDPLVVLIAHSDCEGVIKVREAKALLPRMKEIAVKMEKNQEDLGGHIGNVYEKTQTFIQGLELAIKEDEPLEFH